MNRDALRVKRKGETVWEEVRLENNTSDNVYWWFGTNLPRKGPKP